MLTVVIPSFYSSKMIEERITVLDSDIKSMNEKLQSLEQQKNEAVGMLNALNGARQQCESFLKEFNDEKEPDGSESDVGLELI